MQVFPTKSTNKRFRRFSKKTLVFLEIEQNLILFATSCIKEQHIKQMSAFRACEVGGLVVKVQATSDLKFYF